MLYEDNGKTCCDIDPKTKVFVLQKLEEDSIRVNCSSWPKEVY